MNASIAALAYLVAGVLFILSLRGLSSPETSRRGNTLGMAGMALAVGVTLLISFEHARDRDALSQVLDELDDLRHRLDSQIEAGEQR